MEQHPKIFEDIYVIGSLSIKVCYNGQYRQSTPKPQIMIIIIMKSNFGIG